MGGVFRVQALPGESRLPSEYHELLEETPSFHGEQPLSTAGQGPTLIPTEKKNGGTQETAEWASGDSGGAPGLGAGSQGTLGALHGLQKTFLLTPFP